MKRTPLKRKTELSRGSGLKRSKGLVTRTGLRRVARGRRALGARHAHDPAHARVARAAFIKEVTAGGRCAMCGRPGHCDSHHVIPAKTLKKLGLHEHLWDARNGLPLGRGACHCHESHENRMRPVPRSKLPEAALEFAREHGLEWRLERLYPAP